MMRARWPKPLAGLALALLASACTTPQQRSSAAADSLLDRHVHGFAMAYCLRSLDSKNLPEPEARVMREQGGRWSQIVVERSLGDFTEFFVIMPALDAALAVTPMALVKVEETGGSAAAPVFYCSELLRQPEVQRAMAAARASLSSAYSGE